MADIATLGLAIDSSQVVQATTALGKFNTSAGSAQKATTALEKAVTNVGKSTGALGGKIKPTVGDLLLFQSGAKTASIITTALEKATTDLGKTSGALGNKIKPANDALANVTKNAGLSRNGLLNLSRQLQDVAVSVQGGMPIFTVLAQQGSQIYDVFASEKTATVGGALKQIGSGLASVVTPARLAVGGILAVGAAAAYVTNALGQSALAASNLAKVTGTSIGNVRGFQSVANYKGIGDEESAKAMAQFARSVYDARSGMGGLAEVFRANNVQAKDFSSALDAASTLIRRAKGDTQLQFQLLESMGLPATSKWVKLLEQGGDALRKAINANQGNPDAENKLAAAAQKFDDAWNMATTKASNYIKSWALSAWNALDNVASKVADGAGAFTRAMAGGQPAPERAPYRVNIDTTGTAADKKPVDPAAVQRALSLEQQRLGMLGPLATVQESVAASQIAINQARLNGVNISAADAKRILDNAKANALGTAQIRAQTDAYNVENATLGMTTGSALAYASVQQRINEERRKGNTLTTEQVAALRTEANALGDAAQRAENMRAAYDGLHNSSQTLLSTIRSGGSIWDGFKAAGVSALDAISSKLMKMATDQLWTSAFGGSGGGNFFSNLFGGGSSSGSLPLPGSPSFIGPTFANGGYTGSGGKYEPAGIVHKGEYVIDAASTRRIGVSNLNRLRGYAEGGLVDDVSPLMASRIASPVAGSIAAPMSVPITISIDATGADAAGLQRVEQSLAALKAELPARIVAESKKAQSQRRL